MLLKIENWQVKEGLELIREIGIKSGHIVLDFGARHGNYSIPAAKVVGEMGWVFAIDKNQEALNILAERVSKKGLSNVILINNSNTESGVEEGAFHSAPPLIPLKTRAIDVVLLYDVIHLMGYEGNGDTIRRSGREDRKLLYREVHRVLKSSGIVSVYPKHLDTHTDISTKEDLIEEIEKSGFCHKASMIRSLLHDDNLERGEILNFMVRQG